MKQHLSLLAIFGAVLLAGCMSSGKYVDPSNLKSLTKGKTTMESAIAILGEPSGQTIDGLGHTILTYTYTESTARPETFIPVVGGLVGGADTRFTMATLTFGADGILQNYTYTGSQSGTGMGFAAGVSNQHVDRTIRQPDQNPVR